MLALLIVGDYCINRMLKKSNFLLIVLSLLWLFIPYGFIFISVIVLNQIRLSLKQIKYLCFLISLSFALLAYTQKSLFYEDTDIVRYYNMFYPFIGETFSFIPFLLSDTLLTYTFTIINIILVILFKNVQVISLFWTVTIYYLYFVSAFKIMETFSIPFSKSNLFYLIVFSLFGAILFVQVTETIKNAVAFTLFFYLLSIWICGESWLKIGIGIFLGVGIHSSILMLIPIFLFRKCNFRVLVSILLACMMICPFVNVMSIAAILPDVGIWGEIGQKAVVYALDTGSESSKRYIFISLLILIVAIRLYWKEKDRRIILLLNIPILYLIIMYLNYNNSVAFIRFANFSQFIVALEFLLLLKQYPSNKVVIMVLVCIYFILNGMMTYSRTLSGGYCSSYMDNSLFKILTSNVCDYLSYKAYP